MVSLYYPRDKFALIYLKRQPDSRERDVRGATAAEREKATGEWMTSLIASDNSLPVFFLLVPLIVNLNKLDPIHFLNKGVDHSDS